MPAPSTTNGHRPRVKASDVTAALDDGDGIARLMQPFHAALVESGWAAGMDTIGVGTIAFDLEMREVQQVLGKLAKRVKGITDTTREEIQRLIGLQAENGWSVAELAQQIIEHGITASKARAELISRSETASAYSQGAILSFKASGVVSHLEWLTADDDKTCEICAPLNGKRVALDAEFADGIGFPPAHPACRCAIAPIVSED